MRMKLFTWATIILAVLVVDQSLTSARADLIEVTCHKTSNFKLCVSFLRSKPRSATADVKGLAEIVAEQVQIDVKYTYSKATKLYNEATEGSLKQCFHICSQVYAKAVELADAIGATLKSNKFDRAYEILSNIYEDADTCEESFQEEPVRPSPLTNNNHDVKDFSLIGSEIISTLG